MKFSMFESHSVLRSVGIAGLGAAFFLSSCEEKAAEVVKTMVEEAPAAEVDRLAETRKALHDYALYTVAAKVTNQDAFPQFNSMVKDMLEMMRAYYAELQKGEPCEERARLAVQIATTTRDLGAYTKALGEFENALQEIEALPESLRQSVVCQRLRSTCLNGKGVCLLSQNKPGEALLSYEAAFAVDEALLHAVAPAEGEALPAGDVAPEISRAAADYFDSCRCLGDCQRVKGNLEDARATYAKGCGQAERLKRLSSEMSIAYVKLLTALGNLDNAEEKPQEAIKSWILAARICQSLNSSTPRLDVKAETKRCFDALLPAIQSVGQKLQAEQAAAAAEASAARAEAEKASAEMAEAERVAIERLKAEQAKAEAEDAAMKAEEEKAAAPQQ